MRNLHIKPPIYHTIFSNSNEITPSVRYYSTRVFSWCRTVFRLFSSNSYTQNWI